jgi:MoaA/NifB/PqqE/SkfB family radical SAM enzyme
MKLTPNHYRFFAGITSALRRRGNGTGIDRDTAQFLFDQNVSVMLKMDCLRPEVQDMLAGVEGASKTIRSALDVLFAAGYQTNDKTELRLGFSFVSTVPNLQDIPLLWKFCRENSIYPNHELLILRGRARKNMALLQPSREQTKKLKTELLRIDSSLGYATLRGKDPVCAVSSEDPFCWR